MKKSRLRVDIRGAVQGVGFRPFIHRLARELDLTGWVRNSPQGVCIEVEGNPDRLKSFLLRLAPEKPPPAFIQSLESSFLDPAGYTEFAILPSAETGAKTASIIPDIAVCSECLREMFDPGNRRYLYPFTNCAHCGPRFTIIESLPYDRARTSMRRFTMCDACRAEYETPSDRRFHAQPNACPVCGPQLELWSAAGETSAFGHDALLATAHAIRDGNIAAVKGLGGFHLMVDARNDSAVTRLRQRKRREEKPFALMFPSLDNLQSCGAVSDLEERLLLSPQSPIVLIRRRSGDIAPSIAPGNPYLGAMLPYTPLHHILMRALGFPVVATSGNVSDETICIDETAALERLRGVADVFLVHNRPIVRHADDSIARIVAGREQILRRARGYAPLPISVKEPVTSVLAVGGHLKNAVALGVGREIFVSQHIGDLETLQTRDAFAQTLSSLKSLYDCKPKHMACDMHPDYASTLYAEKSGAPCVRVQHHYAHVLSCMAENDLQAPLLGVAWDGAGYGPDGTVWGGEFLRIDAMSYVRFAHFRTFPLPGGEQAVREPRRAALGLLYELLGDEVFKRADLAAIQAFSAEELRIVRTMLANNINSPKTSSVGRIFDAVACIAGLRQKCRFEGQAAMELEFALEDSDASYPIAVLPPANPDAPRTLDWGPMAHALLDDVPLGVVTSTIAAKLHNALVETIVAAAMQANEERVVLTGGCFQNKYLAERAVRRLREAGFRPYWHQRIPPNDGGIALGQVMAAARLQKEKI